tara:strand:- start:294 stop:1862 length:1569 start_codon:yes stop_codon:yes gene_type:complete
MAEQIPTSFQEQFSIDFFDLFTKNDWVVNDRAYRKLLVDCFGRNGAFPFATNFPSTDRGIKDREEWRSSFDKQVMALQLYMMSRDISTKGWVWSRGDGMMGFLNDIAQERCGVKGSLDSWNPMDIVAVQKSKQKTIKDEIKKDIIKGVDVDINKDLLNSIMIKYIKSKDLMPISLKKIAHNERGAFEESDNLKGRGAKLKHKHHFKYSAVLCDLEWSTYKNEWKNAQEVSWSMSDDGSVTRAKVHISVQARAFRAADAREKPQHSLAQQGAGAMLGKAPVGEIESFLTDYGVSKVHSPSSHPQIPGKGKEWTQTQKNYWIALQKKIADLDINGHKVNWNNPGSYGEGSNQNVVKGTNGKVLTGFAAALESATQADTAEKSTQNSASNGRASGSRLTAKLWGIEWLWRYYQMSRKGVWDAFAYRMYKSAKKELSDSGPFIKIAGEQGRTRGEKRLRMQKMISENPELVPIYDKNLANKKGVIPDSKKKPQNIVGYESKSSEWDDLVENIEWGEMWGQKKNTST